MPAHQQPLEIGSVIATPRASTLNSLQIISPSFSDPWIQPQPLTKSAQGVPRGIEPLFVVPRLKGIPDVREPRLSELGIVSQENRPEIRVVDPIQAFPGVRFLVVTIGVEAVGLQSTGGVQEKDLKQRLPKAKV